MAIHALKENGEKFYVVVDRNGNFVAKTYSSAIAALVDDAPIAGAVIVGAWKLLAEWRPIGWIDHACAECIPHGDIVIDGFQCAYHKVKRMANVATEKSENCQDPKCVFFGWHDMMHPGGKGCRNPVSISGQEG